MSLDDILRAQKDPVLMVSRRALPESQRIWDGPSIRRVAGEASLAWHGGDLNSETGATGLVRRGGPYEDLVGELVRITRRLPSGDRSVIVYVLETADRETDLSVSRRAFLSIGNLANESLAVEVDVVEPRGS